MSATSRAPSATLGVLLSLFAPGLGQVYYGRTLRGLGWAAAPLTLLTLQVSAMASLTSALGVRAALTLLFAPAFATRAAAIFDLTQIPRGARRAASAMQMLLVASALLVVNGTVAYGVRALGVEAFKIPSGSMIPTLMVGDHIFVDKAVYRSRVPRRGELVSFDFPEHPEQTFIKRVVAVPGDVLEVKNGHPVVNGWEVPHCLVGVFRYADVDPSTSDHEGDLFVEYLGDETYLTFFDRAAGEFLQSQGPFTVQNGEVWVLGDNRHNSHDSRMWWGGRGGGVSYELVHGRAMLTWLAVNDEGVDWSRAGNDFAKPRLPPMDALAPALDKCLRERPPLSQATPP